jgi:polyisoprenoid-binding protein YceI
MIRHANTAIRRLALLCILATCVTLAPAALAAETYVFDQDHTEVRFSWDHLGFSTTSAYFRDMTGTLRFDEDDPAASEVDVTIDAHSIDTGRAEFTEHLRSDDFFHVEEYPEVHFTSTEIHADGDDQYRVDGELTIRGITRDVTLDVTINRIGDNPVSGARTIGFNAETQVMRSDFDLDMYVPAVGDEVTIHISSEMPREADLD